MKRKILIAFDSFKDCLSSKEVEDAAKEGVLAASPECEAICLPMADGGEGMLEILTDYFGGQKIVVKAHDPLMRPIEASYLVLSDQKTVYIESAAASGLPLLKEYERNPLHTTTFGVGEIIKDALDKGYQNMIIGLGGSATNDAGTGMLHALGYQFFEKTGKSIDYLSGETLSKIAAFSAENMHPRLKETHFLLASDVVNPFCGPNGAAVVFSPQKGADKKMVDRLDKGLNDFSQVISNQLHIDIAGAAGAGAAGGLGGAFLAFLGAQMESGIHFLLQKYNIPERFADIDLILTGEGKSDSQTLMGKVPFGILAIAQKMKVPVILISGQVKEVDLLNQAGFLSAFSIQSGPISLMDAINPRVAKNNIRNTVRQIIRTFCFCDES